MEYLFWDLIISILLVSQTALFLEIRKRKKSFIKTAALVLLFFGITTLVYGSFIEPKRITITKQNLIINPKGQTVKIALISDIHLGPYHGEKFVKKIVEKINAENPDLVLMAGDFVYNSETAAPNLVNLIKIKAPKFAALGNHDYDLKFDGSAPLLKQERATAVRQALEQAGVKVLINQSQNFENKFTVSGLDEFWTGRSSLPVALAGADLKLPKIVLSHNPDVVDELIDYPDLVVAGHTHGGQIRLPIIGPLGQIPTRLGQRYDEGLFIRNGHKIFITSGLGTSGPRARLFNPPEIAILEIKI